VKSKASEQVAMPARRCSAGMREADREVKHKAWLDGLGDLANFTNNHPSRAPQRRCFFLPMTIAEGSDTELTMRTVSSRRGAVGARMERRIGRGWRDVC